MQKSSVRRQMLNVKVEITAKLNYLRIAPRKVRLVADAIRGMEASRAERELTFLPKRAALPLLKLLRSAVNNATHNFQLKKEDLRISKINVDGGTTLKRIEPRAFGRAFPIRKRSSHVTLVLEDIKTDRHLRQRRSKAPRPSIRIQTEAEEKGAETQSKKAPRYSSRPSPGRARTKPTDFVRRMFRRKAI